MERKRILVVDDEPDFVRFITDVLKNENFMIISADNGREAINIAKESRPDLILLDWNLSGIEDGLEVCRLLKEEETTNSIPIIMLTVRGSEIDTVLGLEMGADDYITKRAIRPRELAARVKAALRKKAPLQEDEQVFNSGSLSLDLSKRIVKIKDKVVNLRPKEFELLYILMKKQGKVLSRNFLSEAVWGWEYSGTSRAIDTTTTRLRGKLGSHAEKIEAVEGIGYRFKEEK